MPQWVQQINDVRPTSKYLGAEWLPLDANKDAKPYHSLVAGKEDVPFCGSLETTPFGNELIEDLAEQALAHEQLGKHDGTDLLAVSFSSSEYAGQLSDRNIPRSATFRCAPKLLCDAHSLEVHDEDDGHWSALRAQVGLALDPVHNGVRL